MQIKCQIHVKSSNVKHSACSTLSPNVEMMENLQTDIIAVDNV